MQFDFGVVTDLASHIPLQPMQVLQKYVQASKVYFEICCSNPTGLQLQHGAAKIRDDCIAVTVLDRVCNKSYKLNAGNHGRLRVPKDWVSGSKPSGPRFQNIVFRNQKKSGFGVENIMFQENRFRDLRKAGFELRESGFGIQRVGFRVTANRVTESKYLGPGFQNFGFGNPTNTASTLRRSGSRFKQIGFGSPKNRSSDS